MKFPFSMEDAKRALGQIPEAMKPNLGEQGAVDASSAVSVPQMALQDVLNEMEGRANSATKGPWEHCKGGSPFSPAHRIVCEHAVLLYVDSEHLNADANFDFVAAARTDVPKLVKALRYAMKNWGYGVEDELTAILNGENQ